MNHDDLPHKHGTALSIALHILPGVAIGVFYFLVRRPLMQAGFPPLFALMVAVPLVLTPLELGFLLYQGKRKTGRYTLRGVVSYLEPLPWWQYIVWAVAVFLVAGLIFTVMKPVDAFLQERLFSWVPALESGLEGSYSRSALVVTYLAVFFFGAILGPVVEELYFRGYLLPRVPGRLSFLRHSLMFAAYHVFSPWMIVTRTIGLLPLILAVKKKSLSVGIIAHILINCVDVVVGFSVIAAMG